MGYKTDHINHNTLDNRKTNLRICTHSQNLQNARRYKNSRFKYKGIAESRPYNKINPYVARITFKGKSRFLGAHPTQESAAKAYDIAAVFYYGESAALNFKRS